MIHLKKDRRGITLLITLSVISAMFVLVGVLFSYLEDARVQASSQTAAIEATLLRKSLEELLRKRLGSNPSKETLQALYSTPLAIEGGEDFLLQGSCRPLFDRIPITWLKAPEHSREQERYQLARQLFDHLAQQAELKEPERLYELIEEALRGRQERYNVQRWLQGRSGAMDPRTFRKILSEYAFESGDKRAQEIPWERYFLLRPAQSAPKVLQKEFLSPELVAWLYDLDPALVKEEYRPGELSSFLENVGEEGRYRWLYAKSPPLALSCELRFSFREGVYNIRFDYLGKRISRFAFQK